MERHKKSTWAEQPPPVEYYGRRGEPGDDDIEVIGVDAAKEERAVRGRGCRDCGRGRERCVVV